MSKVNKTDVAGQRANSLATIILTRRADLYVSQAPARSQFEILVDILKNGRRVRRQFGVDVIGSFARPTESHLIRAMGTKFKSLQSYDHSLPVILLLFSMPSDDGYLVWVCEPRVENGVPILQKHEAPVPFPLTTSLLNDIVSKIDLWYDAKGYSIDSPPPDQKRTDRGVLNRIIDLQAKFVASHKKPPSLMRLPLLVAYDIAKLGRDVLGDLSQRILLGGVKVLEKEGLLGMKVKIENDLKDITLE